MQPQRTASNKRSDSGLKCTLERNRPSRSKHKKPGEWQNYPANRPAMSSLSISPQLSKDHDTTNNKQNCDVMVTALKLVSAAAEGREREIWTQLADTLDKEHKIRGFALHKRDSNEVASLQSMLVHLRDRQTKLISNLKIELGKRKLQSLDDHELRQNILNLNSYVMRRDVKQSIAAKNQGVDIVTEIYHKFDQQNRLIGQLLNKVDNNRRRMTPKNKEEMEHEYRSKKSQQSEANATYRHRVEQLERENAGLAKQISKIQQQFEFIVEEKLKLEQKLQRQVRQQQMGRLTLHAKLKQLRQGIADQRQSYQLSKGVVTKIVYECARELQEGRMLIMSRLTEQHLSPDIDAEEGQETGSDAEQTEIQDGSESEAVQAYEEMLAEKEIEINKYLKVIARLNEEKAGLVGQVSRLELGHQQLMGRQAQVVAHLQCMREQNVSVGDSLVRQIRVVEKACQSVLGRVLQKAGDLMGQKQARLMAEKQNSQVQSQESAARIEQLQQMVQAGNARCEKIANQVAGRDEQISELRRALEQKQQMCGELQSSRDAHQLQSQDQLYNTKQQNKTLLLIIDSLKTEISSLRQQVGEKQAEFEKFKDATISECGMLLENKAEELSAMWRMVEQQRMINEDLQSYVTDRLQNNTQVVDVQLMRKLRLDITQLKDQLKKILKLLGQEQAITKQTAIRLQSRLLQLICSSPSTSRRNLAELQLQGQTLNFIYQPVPTATQEALVPVLEQPGSRADELDSPADEQASSFLEQFDLCEVEPVTAEELLDESNIVDEVAALKIELAQSFRHSEKLAEELRIYRQKDIDKIFDF